MHDVFYYIDQTIYHQLPRLSNVSLEEWISKENFEEQILINNATINIRVQNVDHSLSEASIPYSILKSSKYKHSSVILLTFYD